MSSRKTKPRSIKYGDSRTFFESKTTTEFVSPGGYTYPAGTAVRSSTHINIDGKLLSVTLPSMAELIYFQANENLKKASSIKRKALNYFESMNYFHIYDEELFFSYIQLCCAGVLGLYSSLEAMVHELHIRRSSVEVRINGELINLDKLSNEGFERKITTIASQLSGKQNIYGTELMIKLGTIMELRTNIQHWNQPVDEKYFTELPVNHPINVLLEIDPDELSSTTREILDNYKL